MEVSRKLVQRGHEVTILAGRDRTGGEVQEDLEGMRVQRYQFFDNWMLWPWCYASSAGAAAEEFQKLHCHQPFDLIHFHFPIDAHRLIALPELRDLPKVYTFYGPIAREQRTETPAMIQRIRLRRRWLPRWVLSLWLQGSCTVQKRLQRGCLVHADRVIVLSEHSRREIEGIFGPGFDEKIHLIPGGVDVERFHPLADKMERHRLRESLGLPPKAFVVLTVRRLVKRMGLENLVEAFHRAQRGSQGDWHLVIVGTGPLHDERARLVDTLGMGDRVWPAGFQPEEVLPQFYQCADVFVLPTVALEGFGLVTVEALACGTPVLGTPVGATPEILRPLGEEYLLEGCEVEHIEAGLRRFFASYDPARRDSVRLREYVVSRYSWEAVATQYEQLYEETIAAKQRAPQHSR